jgi:hypothetical protein
MVNQAIQDRIRQSRFAEIGVPFVHGQLAAEHGRTHVQAIVEDFEQVCAVLRGQPGQTPVIDLCVAQRNWTHVANAVMLTFAFRPQRHRQNKLSYST